jgi:hypothetical protein
MATFSFTNLIPEFCQIPSSLIMNIDSCQNVVAELAEGFGHLLLAC